jgi:hypothetical protein
VVAEAEVVAEVVAEVGHQKLLSLLVLLGPLEMSEEDQLLLEERLELLVQQELPEVQELRQRQEVLVVLVSLVLLELQVMLLQVLGQT